MKKIELVILILTFILVGCSDNLSESNARKQIQIPSVQTKSIEYKEYSIAWRFTYNELKPFIEKGLVTSNYHGRGLNGYLYTQLTELGREYVLNDDVGNDFTVKLCDLGFGEIKGIFEVPEMNIAEVEYTLVRKNITPFGECEKLEEGSVIDKKATFQKYNDGWRIK